MLPRRGAEVSDKTIVTQTSHRRAGQKQRSLACLPLPMQSLVVTRLLSKRYGKTAHVARSYSEAAGRSLSCASAS